jgi:hypothetical protein
VLHVPLLSNFFIFIYNITHSSSRKQMVFTLELVLISDISDGSQAVVGVADHQSGLYSFSHFIPKNYSSILLTHVNEDDRLLN